MGLPQVGLPQLEMDDLGDVTGDKTVFRPPMLRKAQGLEDLVDLPLDPIENGSGVHQRLGVIKDHWNSPLQKDPSHKGKLPQKPDQSHGDQKYHHCPQQHGPRRTGQREGLPQPGGDSVADIEMQQINAHGAL